jgi:hypothetical protein
LTLNKEDNPMTVHARRHNPRFRLREAADIKLGSENSASVIDICEAGLRFKASSPLPDSGSVKFRLTSGDSEAVGDLVWTDDSCTTGGIRFKVLPSEIRDQIGLWIDQSRWTFEALPPMAPSVGATNSALDEVNRSLLSSTIPPTEPKQSRPTSEALPPMAPSATTTDSPLDEVELSFLRSTILETQLKRSASQTADLKSETSEALPRTIRADEKSSLTLFPVEPTHLGGSEIRARRSSAGRRFGLVAILVLVFFGAASVAAGHYYPNQAHDALSRAHSIVERIVAFAHERTLSLVSIRP